MNIVSVRDHPHTYQRFVDYFSKCWAAVPQPIYQNCIEHSLDAGFVLPQWYLLLDESESIVGGVGLITNDFISRMDLLPWLCALYVEEPQRKRGHGALLIEHACAEAQRLGFEKIYLCTDHVGYYEKSGFAHIGEGWHPWGGSSKIYARDLTP